jgi:hypothetical protein
MEGSFKARPRRGGKSAANAKHEASSTTTPYSTTESTTLGGATGTSTTLDVAGVLICPGRNCVRVDLQSNAGGALPTKAVRFNDWKGVPHKESDICSGPAFAA